MMQRIAPLLVLLTLASQSAAASQTACTFEGSGASHYYELEFIGYSDVDPTIVFSSTAFASGTRTPLQPAHYKLRHFNRERAAVHLEFHNPGNDAQPPSFSLIGRESRAQLSIDSAVVVGSFSCATTE